MRPREETTRYREVRGLVRGLDVLRALNFGAGGELGIKDIVAITGLHRTTVRRLLETLVRHGYARRSQSDDSFRLTRQVRGLADGFTDDEWIAELCPPILAQLLYEVVWPTDLCTADGDAMVIRETTHRFSPLSFHRAMVGVRLPMLRTAIGRAYLAACPDEERQARLDLLAVSEPLARIPGMVETLLTQTRNQGYGANDGEWEKESKIGAIAVAIQDDGRVQGCINLVYPIRAMSAAEAARKYLPALRGAATKIELALAQARDAPAS